jgi:hypothetical protein
MTQKTKTIQMGEKSFTLKELPVKVLWNILNNEDQNKKTSFIDESQTLLNLACPELTQEALLDLYPSEIEELWHGFEEVNSAFLAVARKVGLGEALIGTVRGAVMSSIRLFATSLPQGTDRTSGNTGTGFFSKLLKR